MMPSISMNFLIGQGDIEKEKSTWEYQFLTVA
jgi:hypothetical protein